MADRLDMSLDDIIKFNKKSRGSDRGGGRVRGHGRGHGRSISRDSEPRPGPTRRSEDRVSARSNPYFRPQVAYHVQNTLIGGESNFEAGTRVYISNLDYDVSNDDIKVLFSDIGELKRYSIHYDRGGRSKGTAEVVYMRHADALAAMKKYNNLLLDGKPMKLELVGANIVAPVAVPVPIPVPPMQTGILGIHPMNPSRRIVGRGQACVGGDLHHLYRGSERGHGGERTRPEKISAEDLDADLDKYRLQALRIN